MSRSAGELVSHFCALWSTPDVNAIVDKLTEDAVYHNIPMEPVQGREAIRAFIENFLAGLDGIDFAVHRQVSDGTLVFNERTDRMRTKNGKTIELPVTGVFEIVDDKIAAWRDYFDMNTLAHAFG
ncbi:limonene-1,2-epoxide hydrolase family protein [Mycobacterium marseillense]|uniref:limonene-1,2-epoxide hydrolase family protein n=1 Tax=Mycobacterium marseillense TaxID=701042 RepID=UPI00119D74FC|nr:limonene-1,2-epoxide hydrolase family protein [Mycobacterium marseillense]MDM3975563.1 limonene-1,2-epoxide hydrolase family protein [Mycobacterium marseillense]